MCELLGMSAARDTDVTELLRKFYSHSDRHPNGWGLAIRRNGSMEITKEPVRASRSEYLGTLLASGVRTDVLLAHIRYATVGGEAYENSHPFTTLCAYKNGRCYFQGDAHGAEYIDRPEDTHYLYTEFAAL